jgi:cobyrinic acid a,c-diamide synthase
MGLVPPQEHTKALKAVDTARELAQRYLDLDGLWQVAAQAPPLPEAQVSVEPPAVAGEPVTIGIIRDSAFQFYYPENLEALEQQGARLVEINALENPLLPRNLDGLYIGGGFPETHARQLSENMSFRHAIKAAAQSGLPIYAECGGLMYLGEAIITQGEKHPMVGLFPYVFIMDKRPQGHGYTILEVARDNPFFPAGTILKGHEFHYSRIQPEPGDQENLVFQVNRGEGLGGGREGLVYQNVLATYTHLHALGSPLWAPALVRRAREYRQATHLPGDHRLQGGHEAPTARYQNRVTIFT